jgi:large subunit ribosomal protein L17
MRHGVKGRKLGRSLEQRNGLRRTLMMQLIEHERIETTEAKAKFIRAEVEKLVTLAKKGVKSYASEDKTEKAKGVHARRLAAAKITKTELVTKLFDTLAPRYAKRPGGYTRILKLGPRLGDAAEMALIEFVEE